MKQRRNILHNLTITTLGCVLLTGCRGHPQQEHKLTLAEKIWIRAEYEATTNDVKTAYGLILQARDDLVRLLQNGEKGLDYNYCLGILNGRLFHMAQILGDTNAAKRFLQESALYFSENRKALRLPKTNFSAQLVEEMIERWDKRVHSGSGQPR